MANAGVVLSGLLDLSLDLLLARGVLQRRGSASLNAFIH